MDKERYKYLSGFSTIFKDEPWHSPWGKAIREIIFGLDEGLVITAGLILGLSKAVTDMHIILLAGVAELFAGGFGLFCSSYLSMKSQWEYYEMEVEREEREIDELPEREVAEIEQIYAAKGFEGAELEMVTARITSDRHTWLRVMMEEELGLLVDSLDSPVKVGLVTGLSFIVGAAIPLLPLFLFPRMGVVKIAVGLAVASLFIVGVIKTKLTKQPWLKSGLEELLIGGAAMLAGYLIGQLVPRMH